jgi:hypothetical protein
MKKLTTVIAINIFLINFCFGQGFESTDFFELGIRTSSFVERSILETSDGQLAFADPEKELIGLTATPMGVNYSTKLRYGKKIFPKIHLIGEVGFSKSNIEVACFCHLCDKVPYIRLVNLNTINTGVGARYQIFNIKRISFSIDAIGSFSFLTNEPDVQYYGFLVQPFVEYQLSKKLSINLKYGYEQSFNDYQKKERYVEFAINYQLAKKG